MKSAFTLFFTLFSLVAHAQLKQGSTVYLTFEDQQEEVNVNGPDAIAMLEDYLIGKTNLQVVKEEESADYVLKLSVIEKNLGNRRGKLSVLDPKTSNVILETKWVKGTMNAFYGYSGSRHAIGVLVKNKLIPAYPEIEKKQP